MEELLTTKQVQELLKIDRTTVYRMLNDGRLTGVKIGQQWRFSSSEIQALLEGKAAQPPDEAHEAQSITPSVLPVQCVQAIQDVFAEIAGIGSVTTDLNGHPLTEVSNSCRFCNLIRSSESGQAACVRSWGGQIPAPPTQPEEFHTCHAGLNYTHARIEVGGEFTAILMAGQFLVRPLSNEQVDENIRTLADTHQLDAAALREAWQEIPVLPENTQKKIQPWLERVAQTFGDIGRERAELMGRLQRIAQMSTIPVNPPD